jgi:hypothetical protein
MKRRPQQFQFSISPYEMGEKGSSKIYLNLAPGLLASLTAEGKILLLPRLSGVREITTRLDNTLGTEE